MLNSTPDISTLLGLSGFRSGQLATVGSPACDLNLEARSSLANQSDKIDPQVVRAQFPIFKTHPELIFFDNAATSQKPQQVIDSIMSFYQESCANAGRAAYSWSTQLSAMVEESRRTIAEFIHAHPSDIAFTSGATDSLNTVAACWGMHNLKDGDEIMLCGSDHQSATLPWINLQAILEHFGITIKIVEFAMHSSGTYDRKSIKELINERTRLIALSHVHHLYGMEMDLAELKEIIPPHVLISLDASQSMGHTEVNVEELGVHFLSCSGHKMLAANGTGVLWVHPNIHSQLWPVRVGAKGGLKRVDGQLMIDHTNLSGLVECGTQNLPGILSIRPAVRFLRSLGMQNIERHLSALTRYLYEQLKNVSGIEFAPGIGTCGCTRGYGIIAFRLTGIASGDLADFLDSEGIFVRTGDHCLSARGGEDDYARVSLHVYNTFEEIDRFVEILSDATH
jgi:cysteine desulfurase/selenocysteine lyase